MKQKHFALTFTVICISLFSSHNNAGANVLIPKNDLEDKIRGGLLGQLFGNLNGLPHEMRYIDKPGGVERYVPNLADGAWSDDDTDIEWIYILEMQKQRRILLTPQHISALWKERINKRIWCSNLYARHLMSIGIDPPLTGRIALNPWAVFNISGQFICESFGLIAPAMPQTAARIGLNYTHVTIDGEPAQTTQLFTTMIATAFTESDVQNIIEAGLHALDPNSQIYEIVTDVRTWWRQNLADWRKTRSAIKAKYSRHGGQMRDKNGYELNTAATIASLLYGNGDFVETLRHAFNFGWDADNNAATCGTIVGVIKGQTWMLDQGWPVKDLYRNLTRDGMPMDETITRFGDRLVALANQVILENGGRQVQIDGKTVLQVPTEKAANLEPLPRPLDHLEQLRGRLLPVVEAGLSGTQIERARAAYLATALNEADRIRTSQPRAWALAVQALHQYPQVIRNISEAPGPAGEKLRKLAEAAGLFEDDG